jgi:hypothetical protein
LHFLLLFTAGALIAAGPEQPLPFSHKFHIGTVHLECFDCHNYPEKFGADMGYPPTSTCMSCHSIIAREKPAIKKLAAFAAAKQPIPWVRVYTLPEFVFFDHRYHLINDAQCDDCHGKVAEQDVVSNDLNSNKMTFCQPCHVKNKAATGCNTCHNAR